jgi:hypothetical protein
MNSAWAWQANAAHIRVRIEFERASTKQMDNMWIKTINKINKYTIQEKNTVLRSAVLKITCYCLDDCVQMHICTIMWGLQ